jgi:Protein of unknown function (DUF3667)
MPTGLEAAADIATGALLGRAVEPVAGERADDTHETSCLNCGTELTGPHCVACGQKAHVHRTLRGFGHDLVHGVFHFDGKIWRTLPMLFWYPGELTRRYINGERAKFVSPLALFLFTVFLTFAVFSYIAPQAPEVNSKLTTGKAEEQYQSDRKDILDKITELEKDKQEKIAEKALGYEWMDGEIARHRKDLKRLEDNRGKEIHVADLAARKFALDKSKSETLIAQLEADLSAAKKAGQPTAKIEEQLEGERLTIKMLEKASNALVGGEQGDSNWSFTGLQFGGSNWLNEAAKHASENPQLLLYKIQSSAYKFSWALIPISLPFLWLLFFWRRQFKLFDHAVFITYSLCFMMMLSTLGGLALNFSSEDSAPFVITVLALIFVPPLHMYRQLHRAYQTSRFGAMWRTFMLSNFALLALALFASLILALGVTG